MQLDALVSNLQPVGRVEHGRLVSEETSSSSSVLKGKLLVLIWGWSCEFGT